MNIYRPKFFLALVTLSILGIILSGCLILRPQFIQAPRPTAPPGSFNVVAIPTGWRFHFTNGSHHIASVGFIPKYIRHTDILYGKRGELEWTVDATFSDKNSDDDYRWSSDWLILGLNHTSVYYGCGYDACLGGREEAEHSFVEPQLKQYKDAIVVLTGWKFTFLPEGEDHHLAKIGIRIKNQHFDRDQGKVAWTVEYVFSDYNQDDFYDLQYYFLIIGFAQEFSWSSVYPPYYEVGRIDCNNIYIYDFKGFDPYSEGPSIWRDGAYGLDIPTGTIDPETGERIESKKWNYALLPTSWICRIWEQELFMMDLEGIQTMGAAYDSDKIWEKQPIQADDCEIESLEASYRQWKKESGGPTENSLAVEWRSRFGPYWHLTDDGRNLWHAVSQFDLLGLKKYNLAHAMYLPSRQSCDGGDDFRHYYIRYDLSEVYGGVMTIIDMLEL